MKGFMRFMKYVYSSMLFVLDQVSLLVTCTTRSFPLTRDIFRDVTINEDRNSHDKVRPAFTPVVTSAINDRHKFKQSQSSLILQFPTVIVSSRRWVIQPKHIFT